MTDSQGAFLRTGLFSWHKEHGAQMVDFAGWSMPILYVGIREEHMSVRTGSGLFDVSHMGRFVLEGADSVAFLEPLVTNYVEKCRVGGLKYAFACNEMGGVLDDLTFFRLKEDKFLIVVNASNREKMLLYFQSKMKNFANITLNDLTRNSSMLALQGPRSMEILGSMTDTDLEPLRKWSCGTVNFSEREGEALVSGSGYTGEDGFEITFFDDGHAMHARALADQLLASDVAPCGLGARDTLRLEAGNPLYGHELSETITPLEAGLNFAIKLDKEFVGRDVLAKNADAEGGLEKRIVGIALSQGIPRDGFKVFDLKESEIGVVTSGTFSPLLTKGIALARLDSKFCKEGTRILVDVRERFKEASVVAIPFYDSKLWGRKREAQI